MAEQIRTMAEALAQFAKAETFRPVPFYSSEGDFLTVCLSPELYYDERIDDTLTVFRSMKSDDVVGCKLKGVSILVERVVRTVKVEDDKIALSFLLLNAVGKTDAHEELYYDVSERLGTVQIPPEIVRPVPRHSPRHSHALAH